MSSPERFVFVNNISRLGVIFSDLEHDERVTVLDGPCKVVNNDLLKLLRKVHLNGRVNSIIDIPFKGIWSCSLYSVDWTAAKNWCVIFTSASLYPIEVSYLERLRHEHNVSIVLYLTDTMDSPFSASARDYMSRFHFDHIFTLDQGDAERYGFLFSMDHYSMIKPSQCMTPAADVYFSGMDKGRASVLREVYDHLVHNGASAYFRISNVEKAHKCILHSPDIVLNKKVAYDVVLGEMNNCRCILEIPYKDQVGATLRYFEAVCYNKKLLTTNKSVVGFPFYDSRYIHVFEKPEDIDCDWVKDKSPIDYGYDGRFSPCRLIDRILELED